MSDVEKLRLVVKKIKEVKESLTESDNDLKRSLKDLEAKFTALSKKEGPKGDKGEPGRPGKDGEDGSKGDDGKDASTVSDIYIAGDDHLVFVFSDGSEIDAGEMPGGVSEDKLQIIQQRFGNLQEIFIESQPSITYPALSYSLVTGTDYYTQSINVP